MWNKKISTAIDDEKKKSTNLYNALVSDSKSVFYATDKITKALLKKARNSLCEKDIVFVDIYNGLENKRFLPEKVPLNAPLVKKKKKNIIRTTLYSFSILFEALQADIAYINFLARSAVAPKFCLLFVDLFTSKIYKYTMKKNKYFIKKKMELFHKLRKKKILQNEVTDRSRI